MSTSRPHRRLSLTQPTEGAGAIPATPSHEDDAGRWRALDARLARIERALGIEGEHHPPAAGSLFVTPFRILDPQGRVVLVVDSPDGQASLRLLDAAGNPIAVLAAQPGGGGIGVCAQGGRLVSSMFAHEQGGAISVRGTGGETVATLYSHAAGGSLNVSNERGETTASLDATPEGGRLDLNRRSEGPGVRLMVRDTGGGLTLFDKAGHAGAILAAEPSGAALALNSPDGEPRVHARAGAEMGVVETWDSTGRRKSAASGRDEPLGGRPSDTHASEAREEPDELICTRSSVALEDALRFNG